VNARLHARLPSAGACSGALLALLISIPFCGWAFGCGCDWPWRGFIAHCNYFLADTAEKCPWCLHSAAGTAALTGAAIVGAVTGGQRFASWPWPKRTLVALASVLVFLGFCALVTHYFLSAV
jgi:hypothetical protein